MRFLLFSALLCGLLAPTLSFSQQQGAGQGISLLIEPTATPELRGWINDGLRQTQEFVSASFDGLAVSRKVTAYASSDPQWLTNRYMDSTDFGETFRAGKFESFSACEPPAEFSGYFIFLCLRHKVWSHGGEVAAKGMTGHEYWHVVQTDLIGEKAVHCCTDSNAMSVYGPEWLKEGSADFIRFMLIDALRLEDAQRIFRRLAQAIPQGDLRLQERNTRKGYRELDTRISLFVGILATRLLVEQSGYPALAQFYRHLGEGMQMEEAFAAAFGRTLPQFEDELASSIELLKQAS